MRYLKKRATFRGSRRRQWIALLHADGKLPNLALSRLSTHYRGLDFGVRLVRAGERRPLDLPRPVWTFGSSIFDFSAPTRELLERDWGPVAWGGTGIWRYDEKGRPSFTGPTLENVDPTVEWRRVAPDYTLYRDFLASLGFTQRGCRLKCHFCVVPTKEGKPAVENTVPEIWRGEGHARRIVLLDNDFFGQPREEWRARVEELRGDPKRADAPRKGHPDPAVRAEVRRLLRFARWVATGLYRTVPWSDYNPHIKAERRAARKAAT